MATKKQAATKATAPTKAKASASKATPKKVEKGASPKPAGKTQVPVKAAAKSTPAPAKVAKKPVAAPVPVKKAAPAAKKPAAKPAAPAKPAAKVVPAPAKGKVVAAPAKKQAPVAKTPVKKTVEKKVVAPVAKPVKKAAAPVKEAPKKEPIKKEAPKKAAPAPPPPPPPPAPKAAAPPKAPKPPKVPVRKILPAASLDRRAVAAKASLAGPTSRPTATPAAKPTEKKPSVIIAHRKLENKSSKAGHMEELPAYQPEVYRSLLDEPLPPPITVYRYNDDELAEFRELISNRLEAARKEMIYLQGVITRKDEAGTEDTENRYMNMEDGSGAMEREQLAQLASRQIQFVGHLEKALIRIENKTYGVCRVTGKLIEKARLRAVPHATLSIEAKKMMNTKQN